MQLRSTIVALVLLLAFGDLIAQVPTFTDMADTLGITYSYVTPGSYGGGVSIHDWDGDGRCDISFGSTTGDGVYVMNNQSAAFTQLNLGDLTAENGSSRCILWSDVDNDGDKDLFVVNEGGSHKLFRNDNNLSLTDVSAAAGLSAGIMYSYAACMGDYDNDGLLDIYIVNRNIIAPSQSHNKLYRNKGNMKFQDVTAVAGVTDSAGLGFAAVFFDYDNDGFSDIFVANDKFYSPNKLFRNTGDGRFIDVSDPASTGLGIDAMGIAVGDYDNNGYLDLYVTNTPQSSATFGGNIMLKNLGNGQFTEVGDQLGVRVFKVSWGANFADFDNDGDLDLFVASGQMGGFGGGTNNLFLNQGNGTFIDDVSNPVASIQDLSFGSAVGDYDDDGCYDIAVMNGNGTDLNLWKNQGTPNNYIKMTFEGTVSNRDGIGLRVHAHYAGTYVVRYTHCGISFGSQSSNEMIIGIGQNTTVDSVVTFWPSGIVNSTTNAPVNVSQHIVEDTATCPYAYDLYTDSIGKDFAKLHWSINAPVHLYRVRGKAVGTDQWINITQTDGSAVSKVIGYLDPNTEYDWQIRPVCNAAGTSSGPWSEIGRFQTLCEEPAFIASTVLDSSTVKLSWQPVDAVAGYQILGYNSLGQIVKLTILDGSASEYVVYNLEYNATYKWRMQTICDDPGGRLSPRTPAQKFNISWSLKGAFSAVRPVGSPHPVIYPNPSSGSIQIIRDAGCDPDEAHAVTIFDSKGRVMFHSSASACHQAIDLNAPSGTYFIKLSSGTNTSVQKLLLFR